MLYNCKHEGRDQVRSVGGRRGGGASARAPMQMDEPICRGFEHIMYGLRWSIIVSSTSLASLQFTGSNRGRQQQQPEGITQ